MRSFSLFILLLSCLGAHELIYISNDPGQESLEKLHQTYRQTLLINDEKVYLIPSECRLERYFGGASEAPVKRSKAPEQTQTIILTQALFEAKDERVIKEKIEVEKSIALIEGKVAKAFLDDTEGRGYGGASQTPLDFTFQKIAAKQGYMRPQAKEKPLETSATPYQHPSCQLLNDGSGYRLEDTKNAYIYSGRHKHPISHTTILFD